MLKKLFVDDKNCFIKDGFTLYSYSSEEISQAVKLALDNGFKYIKITESTPEEKLEYDKRKSQEKEEIEDLPFN